MPGPTVTAVPPGTVVVLDRRARVLDGGAVLVGGAPPRMLRLAPAARALVAGRTFTTGDPTSAALARKLLDAGIAHPVFRAAPEPATGTVTVVVPVKDRTGGLARLLDAIAPDPLAIIVVDDGSADPDAVLRVADRVGARVVRHPSSRGPAAARNSGLAAATTPLVAFLDSDVVPEPGWLAPLLACFADPAVGLAAPRVVALAPIEGWLGRYEAVRSSLDLGPDPALVVPRSRVAYVPSAALLVRRDAVGGGFDEAMRVAEDVDLILRLHAEGWRLRYAPSSRVAHEHRTSLLAWFTRKAFYGTGAAPLAVRHPGAVPPMVLSPWSAAVAGLLLSARWWSVPAAVAVGVFASRRLAGRLAATPAAGSTVAARRTVARPQVTAARLIALGAVGAVEQTADAVTRHYWPLAVLAAVASRRARRTVVAVAVAQGVLDWWRHRRRDPRVRPDPVTFVLARRLDDVAYGAGLWWGAWRNRTLAPLVPASPSPPSGLIRPGDLPPRARADQRC